MSKQVVALVGEDSVIGGLLGPLKQKLRVLAHCSIDWSKPEKALRVIKKGNPDAYIICYSGLDQAGGRLIEILRVVKKAAKPSKAKIVGFVTDEIFEGNQDETPYDEDTEPFPLTELGTAQLIYEERVLKYPNSVVFRVGKIWSSTCGVIRRLFVEMLTSECECSEEKVFSLLSQTTLVEAIHKVVTMDLVFYYNLADQGEVNELELADFLLKEAKQYGFVGKLKPCGGESYSVLNSLRWETMSMTRGVCWDKLVAPAIPEVLKALHAT